MWTFISDSKSRLASESNIWSPICLRCNKTKPFKQTNTHSFLIRIFDLRSRTAELLGHNASLYSILQPTISSFRIYFKKSVFLFFWKWKEPNKCVYIYYYIMYRILKINIVYCLLSIVLLLILATTCMVIEVFFG